MKNLKGSYTSMSVDDLGAATEFYSEKVGLEVLTDMSPNAIMLDGGGGTRCMIYPKDDHQPATHTVLNLDVEDIESVVDDLSAKGVKFNQDEGTDDKGISTIGPAKAAWFNDPAGNFVSVTENI